MSASAAKPSAATTSTVAPDLAAVLRQVKKLELRTERLVSSLAAGRYRSAFRGQGMEFDEVRDLLAALPARRMDQAIVNLTRRRGLRGWLEAILFHRRHAAEVVSLLAEVASVWKALESRAGVLRQLADAQATIAGQSRADGLDLRNGRETTIVYVGERAG